MINVVLNGHGFSHDVPELLENSLTARSGAPPGRGAASAMVATNCMAHLYLAPRLMKRMVRDGSFH